MKQVKNTVAIICCLTLCSCVPVSQSIDQNKREGISKKLLYEDYSYEPIIKTVQLTPKGNIMLPAVVHVGSNSLRLTFDQLSENIDNYKVKIINCTKNWRPSGLSSLEYLTDYNEFDIVHYEFSLHTQTPYVYYTFDVPAIKRSGNYLLIVYRTNNENDIILTKRLMVVEPLVSITTTQGIAGLSNLSKFNQQIDFTINYPGYPIDNPLNNLNVSLRQNQRNDNQISGLKPSFIREDLQQLEYRFFARQNTFSAVNEFRFFDLKSLLYPGQNVHSVDYSTSLPKAVIALDKPRTNLAYAQYKDNNGQYIISDHLNINGNYVEVTFNLSSKKISHKGNIYLFGEFTNWRISDEYRMRYDPANEVYTKEILLKQGYYEYQYLLKSDSVASYIEGNHYQAENSYEILVYYKPYNERSDLLIGYYTTTKSGSSR